MLASLLWIFGICRHDRYTWPQGKQPHVVCLRCGKEFNYDLQQMKRGEPCPER